MSALMGREVGVNTQINAHTLPQLRELMDIIIDAGCHNWQLAITTAMGNAADHPDMLLQPWQMLDVMPLLAELAVEGGHAGCSCSRRAISAISDRMNRPCAM